GQARRARAQARPRSHHAPPIPQRDPRRGAGESALETPREDQPMAQFKNYVAGEWIESPQANKNINPADLSDVIGEYARADRALVERAIEAAAAAFPKWSMSNLQERADILDRIGTEILARKEELGKLLTREEGKTIAEGIGEAGRAGAIFKFFA